MVFSKGIFKGLKFWIPEGGQNDPSSKVGLILEWKNLQKNDKKKNISEVINKTIPHLSPIKTWLVWNPWKVLSREISRHQVNIVKIIINLPKAIIWKFFVWNSFVEPESKISIPRAPVKGHGL
jgi:hypothetical protein